MPPQVQTTLLQPSVLSILTLHLGQVLRRASVLASSSIWRSSIPFSFFDSSHVNGRCEVNLQRRQLVFSHSGFRQRNSLSTVIGGQIAAKSQNGHLDRFFTSASRRSACCWMRSSASNDFASRNLSFCSRLNGAVQSAPAIQISSCREFPISLFALFSAHSKQKK